MNTKPSKAELIAAHGTLEEFSAACWNAIDMLEVDEIVNGIEKYKKELEQAELNDQKSQ